MSKNLKKYFTTGEFAKLCKVKKQTLFHYDDIGILSPDIVGENGYRYYSYGQLETFYTISMLKELDMPLADIKEYLDSRSPTSFISLLKRQKQEVNEKIKELQWLRRFIDTKISITEEGIAAAPGQVQLTPCPEEYLIMTEYEGSNVEKAIATAVTEHLNFCHDLDIYSAYSIGGILLSEEVARNEFSYSHFFTRIEKADYENAFIKPAGNYAIYYDNHGYENLETICGALLQYAKGNGYVPGPYFYEDLVLDEMSACGEENYMLKVSIMMTKSAF